MRTRCLNCEFKYIVRDLVRRSLPALRHDSQCTVESKVHLHIVEGTHSHFYSFGVQERCFARLRRGM